MTLKVSGYVDGEPVYFEEPEPSRFEAEAEVDEKPSYEVEITAEDEHGNVGMVHSRYYMSGSWIEPIWQRTQADVDYALRLNNKIARNGWSSLTPQEQSDWAAGLIGCLNYWDLNRIEMDSEFLSNLLYQYGYGFGEISAKTDWTMTDFPYSAEMERIRSNVQALIDVYHSPEMPVIKIGSSEAIEFTGAYNSVSALQISGNTVQNGIPTPDSPIPILSAGNGNLLVNEDQLLSLPPLRKVGDVADTYNPITGEYVQRIGVKVFDGTEAFTWSNSRIQYSKGLPGFNNRIKAISSHFRGSTYNDTNNGSDRNYTVSLHNSGMIQLWYSGDTLNTGLAESEASARAYLAAQYAAGTPVTVYYQLAEPVTTYLEPQPIQTFYPYIKIEQDGTIKGTIDATILQRQYPLPESMQKLNYKVLNNIENNLRLMKEMIHRMEQSFRYSGTFFCGQGVAL